MSSRVLSTEELEAERQWWSEASERQVRELESSFGNAFRNTADQLRRDLASCQERLERLLEAEKKQRNELMSELSEGMNVRLDRMEAVIEVEKGRGATDVADLKRTLNTQQLLLTELARQGQDMQSLESRVEDKLHGLLRDISVGQNNTQPVIDVAPLEDGYNRLRNDLDSLSLQVSGKDASFRAEWVVQKAQVTALLKDVEELQAAKNASRGEDPVEAAIVDLRRELGDLRRDFKVLQECQEALQQKEPRDVGSPSCGSTRWVQAQDVQKEIAELRRIILEVQQSTPCQKNQERLPGVEASVKDIRRDLALLQEEQQRAQQKASEVSPKLQEIVPIVEASVGDIRRELANLREQQQQTPEAAPNLEEIRPVVEASVADIRRELQAVQRERESASQQEYEALRQDQQRIREELLIRQQQIEDLRVAAASTARTSEEARGFQDLVMQSTCDLGRGLEEISASMVASEEKLRKEMEDLRSPSRDAVIQETCEKQTLELTALRAHLEVVCGQIAELQAQKQNSPTFAARADLDRLGALLEADIHKLEGHVEAIDDKVRAGLASPAQVSDVEATQQVRNLEQLVNSCRTETNNLEEALTHRLGEALAQDRAAYAAEFEDMRHLVEAVVANQSARGVDEQQGTNRETQQAQSEVFSHALEEVRGDLDVLRVAVEGLEQKCLEGTGESGAPDLQAITHRLDHADGEVRRLMGTMVILSSRVDTCENEVWRSLRDMPALTARLDLVESDTKRLARDSGTLSADIGVLRMIMESPKGNKEEEPNPATATQPEGPVLVPQSNRLSGDGRHARFPNEEEMIKPEEAAGRACGSPPQRCVVPAAPDLNSATPDPSGLENTQPVPVPSSSSTTTPTSLFTVMNSRSTTEPPSPGATVACGVPQHTLPPVLSSDLKASISQLVERVNQTLSTRPAGDQPAENLALTVQQALQDLREKNVSLREVNAGLVEELLAEGAVTASPSRTPETAMKVPGTSPVLSWSPTKVVSQQWPSWQAIPHGSATASAAMPRYSLDSKLVSHWAKSPGEEWKAPPSGSAAIPANSQMRAPSSGSVVVPASSQMMVSSPGILPSGRGRERDVSPVHHQRGASPVQFNFRGKSPVNGGKLPSSPGQVM